MRPTQRQKRGGGCSAAPPHCGTWVRRFRARIPMRGQALRSQRPRQHAAKVESIKFSDSSFACSYAWEQSEDRCCTAAHRDGSGVQRAPCCPVSPAPPRAFPAPSKATAHGSLSSGGWAGWALAVSLLLLPSAGTPRYVGATLQIARGVMGMTGGREGWGILGLTWGSPVLGAVMNDALAVATLIPGLEDLVALRIFTKLLWWGMLFGGTSFGNLTMIGRTANIVALGILEREECTHVGSGSGLIWWRNPPAPRGALPVPPRRGGCAHPAAHG